MADEKARIGGGTPAYEAMLEKKRSALRRALKVEYMKAAYDPKNYSMEGMAEVHDAAVYRYHAMKATFLEFFRPTIRNFAVALCCSILPIAAFHHVTYKHRTDLEKAYRSGEIPYDDPRRCRKWAT